MGEWEDGWEEWVVRYTPKFEWYVLHSIDGGFFGSRISRKRHRDLENASNFPDLEILSLQNLYKKS